MAMMMIVVVGCQNGQDVATEPTTETTPTPTAATTATASPTAIATATPTEEDASSTAGWVACENDRDGYTVRHPRDWETNEGDVLPPCSLFDPDDVEVERGTEIPFAIAAVFRVEPVALERAAAGGDAEEELDREETTVDGRDAVRREVESSGEALRPAGLRSTIWLVATGDEETLVATTHDAGALEYAEKQDLLDRMVDSLELDPR